MKYIFLHGLGQTNQDWQTILDKDSLCPDLSYLTKQELQYSTLYAGWEAYCDSLPKPFSLCGLSLGGILALDYTIKHPQDVTSLVLIGTQYKMPKHLLMIQNQIFRFLPAQAFNNMGFQKQEIIQLTRSMKQLDFTKKLSYITCPTLILCGSMDRANLKASISLSKKIPHAFLQIVEGSSHEVNVDQPKRLKQILEAFWQSI